MAAKYLIHAYHTPGANPMADMITHNLDDKWFRIPPDEPFEVDKDSNGRQLDVPEFYAHVLLQQLGPIYGLVEVPATRTRTGITLDVDGALDKAKAQLVINRHRQINQWATEQLQDRVNKNLPVLPPTGFVAESIEILNIDLGKVYRIYPVGWTYRPTEEMKADAKLLAPIPLSSDTAEEVAVLKAENYTLAARLDKMQGLLEKLAKKTKTEIEG